MKDSIVLHHSASSAADPQYENILTFHNNGAGGKIRPGRGLAYHYFIGKSGDSKQAHDENFVCDNSGNWIMNQRSIAICLAGYFTKEAPTAAQIATLATIMTAVQQRWGIPDERVILHREVTIGHTECPGVDLRALAFAERLKQEAARIPQIQDAIKHTTGSRNLFLTRLLDRLQKLLPNSFISI